MSVFTRLSRWLSGRSQPAEERLKAALEAFRNPAADPLELARRLVAEIRPKNRRDTGVIERYEFFLACLEADADLLAIFRSRVMHFIATRRLVTFFTDSGILPGTGFFSEWWRILGDRLLPEVPDERRLKDCMHVVYDRSDDWRWQEQIPLEHSQRFWALLAPDE